MDTMKLNKRKQTTASRNQECLRLRRTTRMTPKQIAARVGYREVDAKHAFKE